jgi:hypothetical protein
MKFDDSSPFALLPGRGREAHGRGRSCKGESRPVGAGGVAGVGYFPPNTPPTVAPDYDI